MTLDVMPLPDAWIESHINLQVSSNAGLREQDFTFTDGFFGFCQHAMHTAFRFIAQIRNGYPVNQMPFENEHFFLSLVILSQFSHGELLRCCRLSQSSEFSNSR